MKRWTVAEHGCSIREVIRSAGGDAGALDEGRVFIGRRRATSGDEILRSGEVITIADEAPRAADAVVLFQNEDIIAALKPPGISTIPDHAGASSSLIAKVALATGSRVDSLHATSRLDREVSGVVLFARNAAARQWLSRARDEHKYTRRYVAIVALSNGLRDITDSAQRVGTWDGTIGRARDPRHRSVAGRDAVVARSHFALVARASSCALLGLAPVTGRTHQLRVHCSHAEMPIVGDRVYGGPPRVTLSTGRVLPFDRIALHAARVTIPMPSGGADLTIVATVPPELHSLWTALGGEGDAWDSAMQWPLPNS